MRTARLILLAQDSVEGLQVWRAALLSQGLQVLVAPNTVAVRDFLVNANRKYPARLLVLDLKVLAREQQTLGDFSAWLAQHCPALDLVVTTAAKFAIDAAESAWARALGAAELLPVIEATNAPEVIARLLALLDITKTDQRELSKALSTAARPASGTFAARAQAYPHSRRLESEGIDLARLSTELGAAVTCMPRSYLGKLYANCFLGSEACTWLAERLRCERTAAVAAGQALQVRGYLHHVLKQQAFIDGEYYYRLVADPGAIDALDLNQVVAELRAAPGFVATRSYRGTRYADCFIGSEAVDWLCKRHALSREQAVAVGQRLQDLYMWRHVVDEHEFVDDYFFYRFCGQA